MRIAICDDEAVFRKELKQHLCNYGKQNLIQTDILEFSNGADLLSSGDVFDIVFLDYQMPGLDGMETARSLRAGNALCYIIFVTNYPSFVLESFEVSTFRFYQKPISAQQVEATLTAILQKQQMLAPILVCDQENGLRTIPFRNIVYVEGNGKNSIIRTTADTAHSSKTISTILKLLPKHCFLRIHKSYIVNLYYIETIKGQTIYFTNGEHAIIGRSHITEFKNRYSEFVKTNYLNI